MKPCGFCPVVSNDGGRSGGVGSSIEKCLSRAFLMSKLFSRWSRVCLRETERDADAFKSSGSLAIKSMSFPFSLAAFKASTYVEF